MLDAPTLLVTTSFCVWYAESGKPVLTQKFLQGMAEYVKHWPGRMIALMEVSRQPDDSLDHVEIHSDSLPFELKTCSFEDDVALRTVVSEASIVLAGLDSKQSLIGRACNLLNVPVVYTTETSILTRQHIAATQARGVIRKHYRMWREVIRERRFRGLLCKAAGVQCNGTPTFDAYRSLNNNCQLFFDSRTTRDMLVGAAVLAAKHAEMVSGHSLRLVFSGRLTSIKGVDHLPRLAAELRKKGVDFTLDIFGDGALANEVAQDVRARDLSDVVRLRGVARFQEELVPFVSRHSDLFVCCHRQGDPSCTYLETMACGVPVAGYANEALAGLVSHSGAAWTVAMDDIGALSTRICELDRNRGTILAASQKAREFAEANTFEVTMSRRVAHLLACLYKGKHGEASTAMSDAVADAHRGSRRLANQ